MKIISFDIETIGNPNKDLFAPEYKEPRLKKDGTPYADSKTIEEQQAEFNDKAALSSKTGQIALLGFYDGESYDIYGDFSELIPSQSDTNFWQSSEKLSIETFYKKYNRCLTTDTFLAGHYCKGFDIPFIVQRGYQLGFKAPVGLFKGRYMNETIKDTMEIWTCGVYGEKISLNHLSLALGTGTKEVEKSRKFNELWETDKIGAINHLKNDLRITYLNAEKLI